MSKCVCKSCVSCPASCVIKRQFTYCPNRIDLLSFVLSTHWVSEWMTTISDNIFGWITPLTKWCDVDLTVGFFRSSAGLQHSAHGLAQLNPMMRVRRETTDQHLSIHLKMKKDLKSWSFLPYCDIHPRAYWMEVGLHVTLQPIVKKKRGQGLNRPYGWRTPACHQKVCLCTAKACYDILI